MEYYYYNGIYFLIPNEVNHFREVIQTHASCICLLKSHYLNLCNHFLFMVQDSLLQSLCIEILQQETIFNHF